MNSIEKLTEIFSHFPGIGPRQARRFVYYLLTRSDSALSDLSHHIKDLKNEIQTCTECNRFFEKKHEKASLCSICTNSMRDDEILMVVQRDIDLESIEKSGAYKGKYFVLGGSVPILEKEPEKKVRIKELTILIEKRIQNGLKEIILGFNWNPEGENTAMYVERMLEPKVSGKIKITHLGKGLSMGAELEYTDPDTLKNALKNRV